MKKGNKFQRYLTSFAKYDLHRTWKNSGRYYWPKRIRAKQRRLHLTQFVSWKRLTQCLESNQSSIYVSWVYKVQIEKLLMTYIHIYDLYR